MLRPGVAAHVKGPSMKHLLAALLYPFNVMVSECAWCGKIKGFTKGGKGITSGICSLCAAKEYAKFDEEVRKHGTKMEAG
jgi:hypothetical protein